MRHFYLLLFFLSISSAVSAQSYTADLITNKVTVNSPSQTVVAFTKPVKQYISPQNDKFYFWYSANQIKSTQGGFSGKLLNGPYNAFYMNKNLKEQGEFKRGLQHGEWKSWYENGQLKEVVKWRSGVKTGPFEEYTTEGQLQKTGRFKKGELDGKLHSYSGKDSVNVSEYEDGQTVVKKEKKKSTKWGVITKTKNFIIKPFKKKNKSGKAVKAEKSERKKAKQAESTPQNF